MLPALRFQRAFSSLECRGRGREETVRNEGYGVRLRGREKLQESKKDWEGRFRTGIFLCKPLKVKHLIKNEPERT